MSKNKILSALILFVISLFSCYSVKSCTELSSLYKEHININYNVTGYYTRSTSNYVFLHNDKYGNFTVNVSPKTYYDVEHGKNVLTFNDNFSDLLYNANDESTKEKIWKNCKDFNVEDNFFTYYEKLVLITIIFGYFGLLILLAYSTFLLTEKYSFENVSFISSLVLLFGALIWSIVITFI